MADKKENSLLKRVFSAIFFGVGGAAGSRVFMALANILLANILGQDAFGRFSSVNTTVNLFVTFSGMGISATITRYVAANRLDKGLQGMYIRTLSRLCLVMSLVLSAAMMVFARQISVLSTGGTELTVYFRVVAVAVFFASMSAIEQSVLIGFEQFAAGSAVQLIRCLLFCVLGYIFSKCWGIYGAVASLVVTHGIQYGISLAINHLYMKKHAIPLRWSWNAQTVQAMVTFALPAFASVLFVLPVNWIGNAILTRTAGFAQVALFAVAQQWMTYITYVPSQMGQMRPIYTDLYTQGEGAKLKRLLGRTLVLTTAAAAVIGAVVLLFSRPILGIYGEGYTDGQFTLAFMILAAVLYTAQVQTGFLMQATGKMWFSLGINCLWGVSLLVIYFLLRHLGALGYAIGYSGAYLITLLLQLVVMVCVLRNIPVAPVEQNKERM